MSFNAKARRRREYEMSAWRKNALEMLPEYRQLIEKAETPMALWIELKCRFSLDYKTLSDDLIGRFYKYAKCSLEWPQRSEVRSDVVTAVSLAFYEHLTDTPIREDMHRWISNEDFLNLEQVFRYHLEPDEYERFKKEFLENREKFLRNIPNPKK